MAHTSVIPATPGSTVLTVVEGEIVEDLLVGWHIYDDSEDGNFSQVSPIAHDGIINYTQRWCAYDPVNGRHWFGWSAPMTTIRSAAEEMLLAEAGR